MNIYLLAAAIMCVVMALGHTAIGTRWVLPRLAPGLLPATPFGPGQMTSGFIKVTWHAVGIILVSLGGLLLLLASTHLQDGGATAVRAISLMFAAATVMVIWLSRRHPINLVRAPMWLLFVAVAVTCWLGASG